MGLIGSPTGRKQIEAESEGKTEPFARGSGQAIRASTWPDYRSELLFGTSEIRLVSCPHRISASRSPSKRILDESARCRDNLIMSLNNQCSASRTTRSVFENEGQGEK
jgi:hypothetical protein